MARTINNLISIVAVVGWHDTQHELAKCPAVNKQRKGRDDCQQCATDQFDGVLRYDSPHFDVPPLRMTF